MEILEFILIGIALGLSLAAAVLLQVRFGLLPLKRLGGALEEVRRGAAPRLAGDWPHEVGPLVRELNTLLDQHATRLARARTEAADLAHALKTPISVLRNAWSNNVCLPQTPRSPRCQP